MSSHGQLIRLKCRWNCSEHARIACVFVANHPIVRFEFEIFPEIQGKVKLVKQQGYKAYHVDNLTLCTPMSSVTRHQFLSQELLCRVPLDILSVPPLFVRRKSRIAFWKLFQDTSYTKKLQNTTIVWIKLVFKRTCFFLYLFKLSYSLDKVNFK